MIEVGQILNDTYEIIERLGSGSGGIIFKAYHKRMKKYVAIKLIKDDYKDKLNNRSEVDVLKNLKNDYLPQVHDFVEDGNDVYTVMEFIEGDNFNRLIDSGGEFDEKSVRKYALQLCSAVEYLHNHIPPIIHSDIKPANIMLTPNDDICLIDFNISTIAYNGTANAVGGSKGFAAPEQFKRLINVPADIDVFHEATRFVDNEETEILMDNDDPQAVMADKTKNRARAFVDVRTDIYGIGASLYYILTGRFPVDGKTDFRGIRCSAKIKEIIAKAMDPVPQKRYKNISELKKALRIKISFKPMLKVSGILLAVGAAVSAGGLLYSHIDFTMNFSDEVYDYTETVSYTREESVIPSDLTTETSVSTAVSVKTIATAKIEQNVDYIQIKSRSIPIRKTRLDLSELDLTNEDIEDLGKLKDLKRLNLYNNKISDLSFLKELTNLESLFLDSNQISDLTPLKGLSNLKYLYLSNNQMVDINPLKELTNLEVLCLKSNQISDLTPLKGLTNLTCLYLYNNQIENISPLGSLTHLTQLDLQSNKIISNQVDDLSSLKELTNLTSLYLNVNQINDISPLKELTNLEHLSLGYNQISEADKEGLKNALPNCDIDYSNYKVGY